MIETKNNLLKGKSTIIKNKQYLSTAEYISPFFDKMDELKAEYIIRAKSADQISITNSNPDIIYNRIHIQAILPVDYYYENDCNKCIGFIYSLDTKIPTAKFYIADIDENQNLYAFDYSYFDVQKIEEANAINYSSIDQLLKLQNINKDIIHNIKNLNYSNRSSLINKIGEWIDFTLTKSYIDDFGKVKLSTSLPIDAYKSLLIDKDSSYYIEDSINEIKIDQIYLAFADLIKNDKDIINSFEKTVLLSKMFNL